MAVNSSRYTSTFLWGLNNEPQVFTYSPGGHVIAASDDAASVETSLPWPATNGRGRVRSSHCRGIPAAYRVVRFAYFDHMVPARGGLIHGGVGTLSTYL
jgi:hypothetical protein